MIRFILTVLILMSANFLTALGTGDSAVELKSKFYNSKVFKARFYVVDAKNKNKLKVLVFARLLADDFLQSEALLDNIGSRKNVSVGIAAESLQEIEPFLKMRPDFKYPLLFDRDALNKYMEKNIIYPRAFVIDYQNRIIWDGELIDLPGMLDSYALGQYDMEKNRKINRYLAEMQNAMRNGSEYQLDRAAREILAISPGNMACLRMRMFAFENTNRMDDAWNFLEEFRRRYPNEKNLYLHQIDMGARFPAFAVRGAEVAAAFVRRKLGSNEEKLLVAWLLANHYQYNNDALSCAGQILVGLREGMFGANIYHRSLLYRAGGLVAYKKCDAKTAVERQRRAYEILKSPENLEILRFYEKLIKK